MLSKRKVHTNECENVDEGFTEGATRWQRLLGSTRAAGSVCEQAPGFAATPNYVALVLAVAVVPPMVSLHRCRGPVGAAAALAGTDVGHRAPISGIIKNRALEPKQL